MEEPNAITRSDLKVGVRVFYPAHGVASVTGTEEREFGGKAHVFYVLALERGITVLLPLKKADRAGLRELLSAKKARELLNKVKTDPETDFKSDAASRKARYALYTEALRSGSADRYTEILQELLFRSRNDKLSTSEQNSLDTARNYFVDEVSYALNLSKEKLEDDLRSIAEG